MADIQSKIHGRFGDGLKFVVITLFQLARDIDFTTTIVEGIHLLSNECKGVDISRMGLTAVLFPVHKSSGSLVNHLTLCDNGRNN